MPFRRKPLILAVAIAIFSVIAITAGVALFFSPLLTKYVESDAFRIKMEEETAKGLHFPRGRYARIRRTGAFTAQSDRFEADNGRKAMRSLDAHGITAKFNPWGVFLRQWRLDGVHVQSGEVEIQIYEAHPEPVKPKPWFAIFCRIEFIWRRFNQNRPTSPGDFAANERASSERNCSLPRTAGTSITLQRAAD